MITAIAFSPDSKLFATAGEDPKIKIWHFATGMEVRTIHLNFRSVGDAYLAFSPDGRTLFSGTNEKLSAWEVATGKALWEVMAGRELRAFSNETQPMYDRISAFAMSCDGRLLATAVAATIKIWDARSGKLLQTFSDKSRETEATAGLIGFTYTTAPTVTSLSFAPDGRTLASADGSIAVWNVEDGKKIESFSVINPETQRSKLMDLVIISPDGAKLIGQSAATALASPDGRSSTGISHGDIVVWDFRTKAELYSIKKREGEWEDTDITGTVLTPDGKTLSVFDSGGYVRLFRTADGTPLGEFAAPEGSFDALAFNSGTNAVAFSPDGTIMASAGGVERGAAGEPPRFIVRRWDLKIGKELPPFYRRPPSDVKVVAIYRSGDRFVTAGDGLTEWNIGGHTLTRSLQDPSAHAARKLGGEKLKRLLGGESFADLNLTYRNNSVAVAYSPDGKILASKDDGPTAKLWDIASGRILQSELPAVGRSPFAFTPDGKRIFIIGTWNLDLWDVETGKLVMGVQEYSKETIGSKPTHIRLDPAGKELEGRGTDGMVRYWDAHSGDLLRTVPESEAGPENIETAEPRAWDLEIATDGLSVRVVDHSTKETLATIVSFGGSDWVVTTPDGRFDTNQDLESVQGLHWVLHDEPLDPVPLDIFMRQYYEPHLLRRVLECSEAGDCAQEFKPLPSIAEINRVQPKLSPPVISPRSDGTVDVSIDVESVEEESSISDASGVTRGKMTSGVYDLRLFRNGQLVAMATPRDRAEQYIAEAARNLLAASPSNKLMDSPDDRAWRAANDVLTLNSDDVKKVSPTKARITFRNVGLPRDGNAEVEFSAYAFNSDRVRSGTVRTMHKIEDPQKRPGRAYVISIGVNAYENSSYNLKYAANDARKMLKEVGARLNADGKAYSEVVLVPLISENRSAEFPAVNNARKTLIRGVFSLLSGRAPEVPNAVRKQIPNADKLRPVEPEDTLIVTFAGHGYADRSGIFYLLPNDIGTATDGLGGENVSKLISSDELSLWMRDITAAEMIMVIDACYSSTAVQGEGFKPGPMGSRGLGQLAYDKGIRILSATQADNVALELGSLKQGLLTYVLLEEGVVNGKADTGTPADGKLTAAEWLNYAVSGVPILYEDVRAGKRSVLIGDRSIDSGKLSIAERTKLFCKEKCARRSSVQQPSVFDFRRKKTERTLLLLR